MMRIPFSKYQGCGNDFILIDNRTAAFATPWPGHIVERLCHRQSGIGADGIIFLESSRQADFRMRIFNANGSEAEMCGNGIRCLTCFIQEMGIQGKSLLIETMHSCIPTSMQGEKVRVAMPSPTDFRTPISLVHQDTPLTLHYLDTGVPHAVIFVDHLENHPYQTLAPSLRHHPYFHPRGTNVNLAKKLSPHAIEVRTFERGVEQETLACGTGAVAVALAAAHLHQLKGPLTIHTRSQDVLEVGFTHSGSHFADVTLTGPAVKTFHGEFEL